MMTIIKKIKFFIIFILCLIVLCSCSDEPIKIYDGEFLEKKLSLPYIIEGVLTQNGEKYNVLVDGSGKSSVGSESESEFMIKFLSGDVTEGLTVEFFDTGVFLFFDDLRFKTNSETFTNLEALKLSLETLAANHIEKYVQDTVPFDGSNNNSDIIEIGVKDGNIKAYVNKIDGTIIRLSTELNGQNLVLDVQKFENPLITDLNSEEISENTEIFDVVDDYIEIPNNDYVED